MTPKGVRVNPNTGLYYARIWVKGRQHQLGSYPTETEAVAARAAAKKQVKQDGCISEIALCDDDYLFWLSEVAGVYRESPERQLHLYILVQALKDLMEPSAAVRDDALQWVRGTVESAPGCTFREVCGLLGLDPATVRRRILSMYQAGRVRRHHVANCVTRRRLAA